MKLRFLTKILYSQIKNGSFFPPFGREIMKREHSVNLLYLFEKNRNEREAFVGFLFSIVPEFIQYELYFYSTNTRYANYKPFLIM